MVRKIIFLVNLLFSVCCVFLYVLVRISPSKQGAFIGATLLVPSFLIANVFFVIFWLVKLDKRVILSLLVGVICFSFYMRFFNVNFGVTKKGVTNENTIKLASYNVLYFKNQKVKEEESNNCFALFNTYEVDFFGLQEAGLKKQGTQPYVYNNYKKGAVCYSLIYSRFTILNSGVISHQFEKNSKRKSISYADIAVKKDTMRVYNLHFESYRFSKNASKLQEKGVDNFRSKVRKVFKTHEKEVNSLIAHVKKSPYPVIVMGDFNNNAYSYEYTQLIKQCNLKDTFVETGRGFGATYEFSYFPTRIDFILVPNTASVYFHKVIKEKKWSDHYPVITEISL